MPDKPKKSHSTVPVPEVQSTERPQRTKKQPPPKLGRGLAVLLGSTTASSLAESPSPDSGLGFSVRMMPIEWIKPNPDQPRRFFNDIEALAHSLRKHGLLQPLLVRKIADKGYEIVAGERRWRAAQQAHLHQIPVILCDYDQKQAFELALVENLQRQDLNPVEEALGYQRMLEDFSYTQADIAQRVGKGRPTIANSLRLLRLPMKVLDWVASGRISSSHAKALVSSSDPLALAEQIIAQGLNVRHAEAVGPRTKRTPKPSVPTQRDPDIIGLEEDIASAIGLKVLIDHKGDKGGSITFYYDSLDQCQELNRRLWAS